MQCTQAAAFVHIFGVLGRTKNDDRKPFEIGALLKPAQDIESRQAWHFQVQQEQVGERILGTIGVRHLATQVVDGFLTICRMREVMIQSGMLQRDAEQNEIRLLIIRK